MRLVILMCVVLCTQSVYSARFALIVGQNNGGNTVERLRYAESDARQFASLLHEYASFSPENTRTLLQPDSTQLCNALYSIADRIEASSPNPDNTIFILYYSGHANKEGLLLDNTLLKFSILKKMVHQIKSGMKIAIFDACQSGALVEFKGGKRAAPVIFTAPPKTKGEVWIASSSANELAQESAALKSSLFSFHFFNGMRGSADITGDRKVSLNEVYQYSYKKTIETSTLTSGIIQHPVYQFNISGEGDIILSDLAEKSSGITVQKGCKGSFLIMSRDYSNVYADFKKEESREVFIALAPGDYTIINAVSGSQIGLHQFAASADIKSYCSPDMFHQSLAQKIRNKGNINHQQQNTTDNKLPLHLVVFYSIGIVTASFLFAYLSVNGN